MKHFGILAAGILVMLGTMVVPAAARPAGIVSCDRFGCSDWQRAAAPTMRSVKAKSANKAAIRLRPKAGYGGQDRRPIDPNGNRVNVVRSKSGKVARVAPSARIALQCVVDYVEAHGVHIRAMQGYGAGTVRSSLHPSGRALDINQFRRNGTYPVVPPAISNAAADRCGVISGARWSYADNGHWNLRVHGAAQEPWPRTLRLSARQP